MSKPAFEHRHYVKIAQIIASIPDSVRYAPDVRTALAEHFSKELRGTNERFNAGRFEACANGQPSNGRDR